MKTTAFLAAVLLSGLSYGQSQHFVSPAGSDSAAGTLIMPWKTVQYAIDHATPGCTIFLMGGTYNENVEVTVSGTPGHPVTLTNYNSQNAVLSGAQLTGGPLLHVENAAYFTVTGLELSSYARNNAQGILVDGASHHVEIRNNRVHDIHFSNNAGDIVNTTTLVQPIVVNGTTATAITGLIIDGNKIYNCRTGFSEALEVNGNVEGFILSKNEIHDVTNTGIGVTGHEGVCATATLDQARNGSVRWNRVWACFSPLSAVGSIVVNGGLDCVVENNNCFGNAYGITTLCSAVGHSTSGISVRNNVLAGNSYAGILTGSIGYPVLSGNVIAVQVQNNTLVNNGTELLVMHCENTSFSSNLLYNSVSNTLINAANDCVGLMFDYNVYYSTGATTWTYGTTSVGDLTAWTALTGSDAHSQFTDPYLVNAAAGNYHLLATSPCIDRGDSLYVAGVEESDMDTMARFQNGRIDVGADEFGTAVGIPVVTQENPTKLLLDRTGGTLDVVFALPASKNARVVILMTDGRLAAAADLPKGGTIVHFNIAQLPPGSYIVYSEEMRGSGVKFVK